jgi:hypothetical protein
LKRHENYSWTVGLVVLLVVLGIGLKDRCNLLFDRKRDPS